jgi:hypothetical protein
MKIYTTKYKDGEKSRYFMHKCYIEVYGWTAWIIYSDDIVATRRSDKFVKLLGHDEGSDHAFAFVEHLFEKGEMRSYIFLPFDHKTGDTCPEAIVAHECFHVVYTLAEKTGMKDEEASAYLLQMLVSHATVMAREVYATMKKLLTPTENQVIL